MQGPAHHRASLTLTRWNKGPNLQSANTHLLFTTPGSITRFHVESPGRPRILSSHRWIPAQFNGEQDRLCDPFHCGILRLSLNTFHAEQSSVLADSHLPHRLPQGRAAVHTRWAQRLRSAPPASGVGMWLLPYHAV